MFLTLNERRWLIGSWLDDLSWDADEEGALVVDEESLVGVTPLAWSLRTGTARFEPSVFPGAAADSLSLGDGLACRSRGGGRCDVFFACV